MPFKGDGADDDADAAGSATLAAHFFEDALCAGVDKELSHALTKGAGLVGWRSGALFYVLNAIDGTDTGVENEFAALDACPSAERNLATSFENREQRPLGNNRGASFGVVELFERSKGVGICCAAFDAECALTDGGHADIGRKRLANAMRPAESVQASFRENDGVVFAGFDFAEARVDVAAKIAHVEIWANVKDLSPPAKAARADACPLTKIGERGAVAGD